MSNPYGVAAQAIPVDQAPVDVRAQFITRTYAHLVGAIGAFALLEYVLLTTGAADGLIGAMLSNWMIVMLAFVGVSWVGNAMAERAATLPTQYLGLGLYVVAEAIVFLPLLWIAENKAPGTIESAGLVTALGFASLTTIAFVTRKDFSFLRGVIAFGMIAALILIVASWIFGFSLGLVFSVAMVGLAGAIILYQTSNILHHYPEDRYVGAALGLFAGVALMFWYVLRIFLARD